MDVSSRLNRNSYLLHTLTRRLHRKPQMERGSVFRSCNFVSGDDVGMIQFTVYGEATAQGRPRFTTVNGYARAYDPKKSADYKSYVKLVASQHKPKELITGALALQVDVYRAIPKSLSKKKQDAAERGEIRPITKPDSDNYLKGIKDALKNVIWKDDSQVVSVTVNKWYSTNPRVEVRIYES